MSTALRSVDPGNISLPRLSGLNRRLAGIPSLHVGAAVLSVLLGGLLLSISTTRDPLWWHLHFSQLGIFGDFSSALFNTTLKVSGAMVIVLAHFVRRDILRLGRGAVRRGSATLGMIAGILSAPIYLFAGSGELLLLGAWLIGFCASGAWGIVPGYLSERFPTEVRGVGPGFCYHAGSAMGAAMPYILGAAQDASISAVNGMSVAMVTSAVLAGIAVWSGPETWGRDFSA